jgi:hypothetical protein
MGDIKRVGVLFRLRASVAESDAATVSRAKSDVAIVSQALECASRSFYGFLDKRSFQSLSPLSPRAVSHRFPSRTRNSAVQNISSLSSSRSPTSTSAEPQFATNMQAKTDAAMDLVPYDEAIVRNIIANDQQLLDTKMEKVYTRGIYPKLTVLDFYNMSEKTRAPGIPQEIELAYYLEHYSDFVSSQLDSSTG